MLVASRVAFPKRLRDPAEEAPGTDQGELSDDGRWPDRSYKWNLKRW